MTTKADFNAEEWSEVVQGPPMAGLRVIAAERGGTLRESISMAQAYADARKEQDSSELLGELISSPPELKPQEFGSREELPSKAIERLRSAVSVVEAKAAPEEVEQYRRFVLDIAQRVASAHREGGFLGIGGKPVSESEQAALDEIAATLGEGDGR